MSSTPLALWADRIRRKYLRGEASMFVLHGNVFDHVLHDGAFLPLTEYITRVLLWTNKRNIIVYDPADRVHIKRQESHLMPLETLSDAHSPRSVIPAFEEVLIRGDSTAVLIPYADMLFPAAETHFMTTEDRRHLTALHRWSLDERIASKDNVVFLLSEQLTKLHPMLVSNPRVSTVEIPLPSQAERRTAIDLVNAALDPDHAARLAEHTAGLTQRQIASLLRPHGGDATDEAQRCQLIEGLLQGPNAATRAEKLARLTQDLSDEELVALLKPDAPDDVNAQEVREASFSDVVQLVHMRKREIIERECMGLIEFLEPKHDFAAVGGMDEIKAELLRVAGHIRAGQHKRVPMGMLFVGPMGTGKTFLAQAFAKETGLTAIRLKNFRSKWVGTTEANLEKVLSIVSALGPILLIVDEGDRAFAQQGDQDGGTSSRVMARLKEFMSDPANRGQVLSIVMTNRPDKLDIDLKRAGRLDRKIPFFYPEEASEVEGIVQALCHRHELETELCFPGDRLAVSAPLCGSSSAEVEAVVLLAHDLAEQDGRPLNAATFAQAIEDFLPSRDEAMLEYMELLAVFEASSRRLLPQKFRSLSDKELQARLQQARMKIATR